MHRGCIAGAKRDHISEILALRVHGEGSHTLENVDIRDIRVDLQRRFEA